jgi:hypothetical protein
MLGSLAVTYRQRVSALALVVATACAADPVEASLSQGDESASTGENDPAPAAEDGGSTSTSGSETSSASAAPNDGTGESTDDGASDDGSESTGEVDCPPLAFDASWSYHSNPVNLLSPSGSNELELIPDGEQSRGAAVLLTDPPEPPFRLTFEYTIFDDDGGTEAEHVWSSGDGISIMLLKDPGWYEQPGHLPPTSIGRGFALDGTGIGIHFELYGTRQLVIRDGFGTQIGSPLVVDPSVYPHGVWRSVAVEVSLAQIVVHYEGNEIVTLEGPHDASHLGLGFGAGTGAADGSHRVRNVVIEPCG